MLIGFYWDFTVGVLFYIYEGMIFYCDFTWILFRLWLGRDSWVDKSENTKARQDLEPGQRAYRRTLLTTYGTEMRRVARMGTIFNVYWHVQNAHAVHIRNKKERNSMASKMDKEIKENINYTSFPMKTSLFPQAVGRGVQWTGRSRLLLLAD